MGNKCCKSKKEDVREPQKVAEDLAKKVSSDGDENAAKAQAAIDAQTAKAKAEGEKLEGEIKDLEQQIQAKKDAGFERVATGESLKETVDKAAEDQKEKAAELQKTALQKSGSSGSSASSA